MASRAFQHRGVIPAAQHPTDYRAGDAATDVQLPHGMMSSDANSRMAAPAPANVADRHAMIFGDALQEVTARAGVDDIGWPDTHSIEQEPHQAALKAAVRPACHRTDLASPAGGLVNITARCAAQ